MVAQTTKGLMTLYGKDRVIDKIGHIEEPGGEGLYLGNTPSFAMDYYGGLTDYPDVLLTYEFTDEDLIRGDPDAASSELVVKRAKLVGRKRLTEDKKLLEEINDIRRRAGLDEAQEKMDDIYNRGYWDGDKEGFRKGSEDKKNGTIDERISGVLDQSKIGRITRANAYDKAFAYAFHNGYYDAVTGGYRSG